MEDTRMKTKDRLIESALESFSERWYETVSVAEICRNANLSNGVFYRYFKDKEEIFKEILDIFLKDLSENLEHIKGESVTQRLDYLFNAIVNSGVKFKRMVSVYREGQYRFQEYEKKLADIYKKGLSEVFKKDISEAEYLFGTCGIRFLSIRSLYKHIVLDNKILLQGEKMVLNGIFSNQVNNYEKIFDFDAKQLEAVQETTSREKLISAGMELFGEYGYYNVNVYDIAKKAGFAVGTFYIYFDSKEEFMSELIDIINSKTRHFISQNINHSLNRIEQELQGMYLFLKFFEDKLIYYQIVREAEFVVNGKVKDYYDNFEKGYLKNLKDVKDYDYSAVANFLVGISHYLGIQTLFNRSAEDKKSIIKELGTLLYSGMEK
ncbi:MAG TPA: TetR/AcrR family transcriptional regulator [Petrotogaceae bacterium]|nr:TetR/AcrR family transcriptional regulator [Petrotogaceae bacterium]HQC39958.1 TetR/AcrR family transcriptional regulator [Petrotogaceae bacterium]